MPSPFPGMNPYLEQPHVWRGFHGAFIVHLQEAITPLVVPRYYVEYEESLYIDESGTGDRLFAVADVAVARPGRGRSAGSRAAVAAAPVTATFPGVVRKKHRWLTIRDTQDRTVVAVIELLSPSNKVPGRDRERYLTKRRRVRRSSAHLIEIDLLRGGQRLPIRGLPACDYFVLLSRWQERPQVGVWPFGVRDELPTIPIPLRPGEPEPTIPLKPILDRVYDGAAYQYRIYDGEPDPPLSPDDAEWARQFVPAGSA